MLSFLFVSLVNLALSESQYSACGYKSSLEQCPGTAHARVDPIQDRLQSIELDGRPFDDIRTELVHACGLKDVERETTHCFSDFNHVDCCPIVTQFASNTNEEARVKGMDPVNDLSYHIQQFSLTLNGDENGSWCTCEIGAPKDVCHLQFGAQIAFKAIWCPNDRQTFDDFVLMMIDNDGVLLNYGKPTDQPDLYTKIGNWRVIETSENEQFQQDVIAHCERVWTM